MTSVGDRVPSEVPVLIVGAGPTGMLAANLLGTYGIETLVVERNATTADLPRAILLDDEGLRAVQAVGLADAVLDRIIAGYGARYYAPDGTCFAEVEAPVTENGFHRRNAFLQPDLERVLHAGLDRFPSVRVAHETTVTGVDFADDHVDATVRSVEGHVHEVRCRYLLACDGGRSTVRELLGIAMEGRTDSRDWVVIDTRDDPDRDRFSKFFCDPARPMVSIPAPGGGRRYEYMVMPGEAGDEMARPERIAEVLSRFRRLGPDDIWRAVVYTFHARVAARMQRGRVLLLGDAAHLSPPFAGQGMNAGLRDAFNAAWKVALAVTGRASPSVVDSYEAERRGPVIEMIDYAVALGAIVMPSGADGPIDRAAIAAALAGESTEGLAIRPKPQTVYEAGWLSPGGMLVGRPLPQPPSTDGMRLDDLLGPGFALVGIGSSSAAGLAFLDGSRWDRIEVRRVLLRLPGEEDRRVPAGTSDIAMQGDELAGHAGDILFVRPDRFVAAQGNAADLILRVKSLLGAACGSSDGSGEGVRDRFGS